MIVEHTLRNDIRADWSMHYGNKVAGLYLGQPLLREGAEA